MQMANRRVSKTVVSSPLRPQCTPLADDAAFWSNENIKTVTEDQRSFHPRAHMRLKFLLEI